MRKKASMIRKNILADITLKRLSDFYRIKLKTAKKGLKLKVKHL